MIKSIGIELQGEFTKENELTLYHMTEEEIEMNKAGKISVVGTTTYHFNPNGNSYKEHNYAILNMELVKKVEIFYDTEDDYNMHQKFLLKNGRAIFGMSRDHKEVEQWENLVIPIEKSYGY